MKPISSLMTRPISRRLTTGEMITNYLVLEYSNEAGRSWYNMIAYNIPRSQIALMINQAKEGRDSKRLFSFLAKTYLASHKPSDNPIRGDSVRP